ncbi:hypothetical protein RclHR1_14700003 [Rhizophagus clarus]|uniref:Uncharacterized protein n=1 Tax=Rhizophagus clarus TaxID=94130 RepID=A0A2Z6QU15_9GLOM|nr:hypothetical protein RclHR1_14700003 [Rhizophagus clarus]GES73532.1 hypothetical protein GLOIN_2v1595436 [Rhizophagus clarus]
MMWKNLTLIFILVIATFSNFTFAKVPLKWRRDELFGVLSYRKSYVGILSNYSSLIERQDVCPPGQLECPGLDYCCSPTTCDSCMECFQCCSEDYCRTGLHCTTKTFDGFVCDDVCSISSYIYDSCDDAPEDSENDTLPNTYYSNVVAYDDTTEDSTPICKPGDLRRKCRNKAKQAPYAYIYDNGTVNQVNLSSTINLEGLDADHVFEIQIVSRYLNGDGIIIWSYIKSNPEEYLDELKTIMNDVTNIRFVSEDINGAKGIYFSGKNVNQTLIKPLIDYLKMNDTSEAFLNTRAKVIEFFRKVVNENNLDVPNFDNIDNSLGLTEFENLINKSLVIGSSSNNSSSTLPLLHLPVILSVILSLVFLVFSGCNHKITRMSIPHITKN